MEAKKNNKKVILGVAALVVLIAVFAVVYAFMREKPVEGAKTFTVEVVDDEQKSTTYTGHTDAEYLRQALEELAETEDFKMEGTEGDYGLYVQTVNGVTADYNVDGSYWSFYVNGEICNYGVDTQPVEDGDAFKIVYEIYAAE